MLRKEEYSYNKYKLIIIKISICSCHWYWLWKAEHFYFTNIQNNIIKIITYNFLGKYKIQ